MGFFEITFFTDVEEDERGVAEMFAEPAGRHQHRDSCGASRGFGRDLLRLRVCDGKEKHEKRCASEKIFHEAPSRDHRVLMANNAISYNAIVSSSSDVTSDTGRAMSA